MATPFFLMITIGNAQGEVDGWIIVAGSNPLISCESFSQNWGATARTRWATGAAPPTSISQTAPRAAGGRAFPLPIMRCLRRQMIRRSRSISSGVLNAGSPAWMSSIVTASVLLLASSHERVPAQQRSRELQRRLLAKPTGQSTTYHAEVERQGEEGPRAAEATPKDAAPPAEKSSPKKATPQRATGATSTDSVSRAKKTSPKKTQAPATATAQSAKPTRRTRASKRKEVRLPGPYVEPAPSESDTDTPNPDLITGDEDSTADPTAPRATKPSEGELVSANPTACLKICDSWEEMPPEDIKKYWGHAGLSHTQGYALHEAHPRAHHVYAKRYVAGDRSRKISSLQLRACFALCVLLYFGAIYFADDIASIGRVVGSEQSSQNFFVHSLRPRGRGNMRVGRAVDAKKAETPALTSAAPVEKLLQQDDPTSEVQGVETQVHAAEAAATAEIEEAQATEPPKLPDTETEGDTFPQDEETGLDDVPGDAAHTDFQREDVSVHEVDERSYAETVATENQEKNVATPSTIRVEPSQEINHDHQKLNQDEPHPTAAPRQPEKEAFDAAVPAASPARGEQHDQLQRPKRQANLDRKPSERTSAAEDQHGALDGQPEVVDGEVKRQQVDGQQKLTAVGGQHREFDGNQTAETKRPAEMPAQVQESVTEHISDI
ncbi:unnamed protein product [Phytophthora fragariaefolia]|uniref:Unnamed protein product n=1 Tax=Phytophthora fragariaefolia TaxID=1490495 RepID=A0A9W6XYE8_9STRA|nr:unnamed protein product [Phytophthora fragariaefolia]